MPDTVWGTLRNWSETRLWQEVTSRTGPSGASIRQLLEAWLPEIQAVLAQAGTAPLDFTLHDSQHAFRVAEMMARIVPGDVLPKLSSPEVGLLLLSAYLHDIGMAPDRRKVSSVYRHLVTGEGGLCERDALELQAWLDGGGRGLRPPLCAEQPSDEDLALAEELTTHYCRYRHNDWSEEWIRGNLDQRPKRVYAAFADDLMLLCRSHHLGIAELEEGRFDGKGVGSGEVVQLRYLACVLRVADILDTDPERTPTVVFRHRAIAPGSRIYWWKDHDLTVSLASQNGSATAAVQSVHVSARPRNAMVHHAVLQTVAAIEAELRVCGRIDQERPFRHVAGLPDQPYRWGLRDSVYHDVRPQGGYTYIDGAFRPNTARLLELLSNTALYHSELAAVREILQNAFDAVREAIAWVRLDLPDPSDEAHEQRLGSQHRVTLSVERGTDGKWWLVCADDGVGMTKSIIENYLLVTGSRRRADALALDRECEKRGFALGTTGEFGIGVLSYFMLGTHVEFETHRSQRARDCDGSGWTFQTDGIGSFGELRPVRLGANGTVVRLRLRDQVVGDDAAAWYRQLQTYLKHTLVRLPCRLEARCVGADVGPLVLECGWVQSLQQIKQSLVGCVRPPGTSDRRAVYDLLPPAERDELDRLSTRTHTIRARISDAMELAEESGVLPGGLGRYRVCLPYFKLPGGRSVSFVDLLPKGDRLRAERVFGSYEWRYRGNVRQAWRGMAVDGHSTTARDLYTRPQSMADTRLNALGAVVHIDWTHSTAGRVSVSRDSWEPAAVCQTALIWLSDRIRRKYAEMLSDQQASPYGLLNRRVLGVASLPAPRRYCWICRRAGDVADEASWADITFPAVGTAILRYRKLDGRAEWLGQPVYAIPGLGDRSSSQYEHWAGLHWACGDWPPDRVVEVHELHILSVDPQLRLSSYAQLHVSGLWERAPQSNAVPQPWGVECRFPPEWANVAGAVVPGFPAPAWNPANALVARLRPDEFLGIRSVFTEPLDPLEHRVQILQSPHTAAAFIAMIIVRPQGVWQDGISASDLWRGATGRDPQFVAELWEAAGLARDCPLVFLASQHHVVSPDEWWTGEEFITAHSPDVRRYLPAPTPEWVVTISGPPEPLLARRDDEPA